jgi:hypothetical protein
VAVSGWDLGFELGSCFWKRPTFLLLALGSALENVAAIVNPQNKPTKVNWIGSSHGPVPLKFLEKLFLNKGSISDLIFWGTADKHDF